MKPHWNSLRFLTPLYSTYFPWKMCDELKEFHSVYFYQNINVWLSITLSDVFFFDRVTASTQYFSMATIITREPLAYWSFVSLCLTCWWALGPSGIASWLWSERESLFHSLLAIVVAMTWNVLEKYMWQWISTFTHKSVF